MSVDGARQPSIGKRETRIPPEVEAAPQFGRVLRAFVIISIAVIVSLIVFFAVFASRSYDRSISGAERLTQTLADLIEDQVFRSLQNVQLMLSSVREGVVGGEVNPITRIAEVLRGNPLVRGVMITNQDGEITYSSYAGRDIGWSLRDDELFEHTRRGRMSLAIGVPVNHRSYSDKTEGSPAFIPAAIRITDGDGAFLGLVIAALNPAVFQLQSQAIAENNRATINLIRYDGVLLVSSEMARPAGSSIAAIDPIFTQFLPDRERGTFSLAATRDSRARIVSFGVTRLWPVVVSVAVDQSAALEAWREDTLFTSFIMLAPILLIGGSVSLMGRQILTLRQQSNLVARRETDAIAARYQLELAINAMSDGFCYFDADDRLVLSNSTYRALYPDIAHLIVPGQSCEEFCRAILASGQFEVRPERHEAWIAQRLARHRDQSAPFEEQLPDGRWLRILNQQTPDGGWVGLRTDITELKLREQQLVEAREAADSANIAKSQFLAQMSHEIRTPMNGIMGMTALLADTPLNLRQGDYVSVIDKSAQAMLRVINDILDFSQLEAGRMTLEPVSYDLSETIQDVIALVYTEASAKGLPIHVRLAPETPLWLVGDQDRLRQILVNLLANAIKFTDRGDVTVTSGIAGVIGPNGQEMLEIAVIDTGIGVSPEARSRLFQHFEQGEVGMHRRYGGSGLGLAICRKIVTAMGGKIGVESEKGHGSRFWLRIPLQRSTESRRAQVRSVEAAARPLNRLRVLVAEDNQINQRVIRALLKRMGHACQTVSNGLEAVRAVQDAPFDMVLMDVQMPEMDGVEATTAIRSLGGAFMELPIVAVTANVLPGDAARYIGQGMNGVLAKPIEPRALRAALEGFTLEGAGAPPPEQEEYGRLPSVEHIQEIDFAVIADMREAVGDDIYISLMTDLKRDVRRRLDMVAFGLGTTDAEDLKRGAHSLSSLLSTFGLNNAGLAFGRVEELMRAGKIAHAKTLGALLERETIPALELLERRVMSDDARPQERLKARAAAQG